MQSATRTKCCSTIIPIRTATNEGTMALQSLKLLTQPVRAWRELATENTPVWRRVLSHTMLWALVPAFCWYIGITMVGWQVASEPPMRMTTTSAALICALFYAAMVVGVLALGYLVHWMALTYDASGSTYAKGVTIITFTATPFFLAGVLGLYPSLWLAILVGVAAGIYCVYLLYIGVPIMMNVQPERGFLFSSAVIAVALVGIVATMAATAILWNAGAEPVYRY